MNVEILETFLHTLVITLCESLQWM